MEERPLMLIKAKHRKTYYFCKMQRSEDPADRVFKEERTVATPPRGAAIRLCPKARKAPKQAFLCSWKIRRTSTSWHRSNYTKEMLWIAFGKTQTQASGACPTVCGQTRPDGTLKEPQESKMGWKEHRLGLSLWAPDNEVRRPLRTCQKH